MCIYDSPREMPKKSTTRSNWVAVGTYRNLESVFFHLICTPCLWWITSSVRVCCNILWRSLSWWPNHTFVFCIFILALPGMTCEHLCVYVNGYIFFSITCIAGITRLKKLIPAAFLAYFCFHILRKIFHKFVRHLSKSGDRRTNCVCIFTRPQQTIVDYMIFCLFVFFVCRIILMENSLFNRIPGVQSVKISRIFTSYFIFVWKNSIWTCIRNVRAISMNVAWLQFNTQT